VSRNAPPPEDEESGSVDPVLAALARAPEQQLAEVSTGSSPDAPPSLRREQLLEPGDRAGRFVVTGRIGAGGMGVVFAADDPELHRRVAIKLLRSSSGDEGRRLLTEARALAALSHPNVVTIYDVGTCAAGVFLAMELVEGTTLRQWLRERQRSWREVVAAFVAAGRGLAAAHDAGIVHRDFKPDNVLVGRDERLRVTDFGLARTAVAPDAELTAASGALDASSRSARAGTPRYMAPEQLAGKAVDARADQYAFCVALNEALGLRLTLAAPQPAPSDAELAVARAPGWIAPIVARGLSADPAQRHASMAALLQRLEADPWRARRRLALLLAAPLVLAALLLGARAWEQQRSQLCAGGPRRLEGIWDAPRRAALAAAFAKARPAGGAAAAGATSQELDKYAAALTAAHTQACEAAQIRGEQSAAVMDLRMRCLDRLAQELGSLERLFEEADAPLVARAANAVERLRPVSMCADVGALSAPDPRPLDPARRAQIDELEKRHARASALNDVSRFREARAEAEALVAPARAAGWPPLTAEVLLLAGYAREAQGDAKGAAAGFEEALVEAAAGHHEDLAAQCYSRLALNLGRLQGRTDEARLVARLGRAALRRMASPRRERNLEQTEGLLAFDAGEYAEARAHYLRALELEKRLYGADTLFSGDVTISLGNAASAEGKLEEARAHYVAARALFDKRLGPGSPPANVAEDNLARVELEQGHWAESERLYRRVIGLTEKALNATHFKLLEPLAGLSGALSAQGRFVEALQSADRACAVGEASLGPDHPGTLGARAARAAVLADLGRAVESRALLEQTLAALERKLGPRHPNLGPVLAGLGEAALARGDLRAAAESFERARSLSPPRSAAAAEAMAGRAVAEARLGRPSEAARLAAESLALLGPDAPAPALAFARFAEGEALRAAGRRAEARATLHEAARLWGQHGARAALVRSAAKAVGAAL
jgi:tetratricopeptide (TPR) repeat protein